MRFGSTAPDSLAGYDREVHVSLAQQRRLFLTRWRSLIGELAAA